MTTSLAQVIAYIGIAVLAGPILEKRFPGAFYAAFIGPIVLSAWFHSWSAFAITLYLAGAIWVAKTVADNHWKPGIIEVLHVTLWPFWIAIGLLIEVVWHGEIPNMCWRRVRYDG